MKLLILGGTRFVGRHLVGAALARGHDVSLFNRGQADPELFPEVEKLRGDRDGDLGALRGRRWDAVVDTSGYVPRVVRASAELLAGAVDHYTSISSVSVYSDLSIVGADENAPVGTLEDQSVEEVTGETYGPLKVLCERAVEATMPGRTLIIRPGLVAGPDDPTDRFTYWPHRVAQGGEVLAPGRPDRQVQFIDARDLGEWMVRMVEGRQTGVYNATGPDYVLSMGRLLDECKAAIGSDARFTWVDERFLLDAGVEPWIQLPLWVPEDEEHRGLLSINVDKAIAAGLTFRPPADSIRDTLARDAGRPADREWLAGLRPEREREVLQAWHAVEG